MMFKNESEHLSIENHREKDFEIFIDFQSSIWLLKKILFHQSFNEKYLFVWNCCFDSTII